MQIKYITISRYGMFENWQMGPLASQLQVIYGANEAGKSTLMHFISDMLFGFSSKSPGMGNEGRTFGGRLVMEIAGRGEVTVERLGNKGPGTVQLYFSDGTTGGERQLAELLQGLDRSMFRAIFCFDLDGLRNLEEIGADELSDYLFHAGMAGDLSIRELEKELRKRQEDLYKPKGQKPPLNQKIAELDTLQKDIKAWEKRYDGYRQVIEEAETSRNELDEITQTKDHHNQEIRDLQRQKTLIPYVKEQQELSLRLAQLPNYEPFPEDGLVRYKDWRTKKVELEGQLADLNAKRQAAEHNLDAIAVNETYLTWADEVRQERGQEPFAREKESRQAAYAQTVQSEQDELDVLFVSLGTSWGEEGVKEAETSIGAKQMLDNQIQKREHYRQQLKMRREEKGRKEQVIKEARAKKEQLAKKNSPDTEGDDFERHAHRGMSREKQGAVVFYTGVSLAALLAIWLIGNRQWMTGLIAGALIASFSFYIRKTIQGTSYGSSEHENSQAKALAEEHLSQELNTYQALTEDIQKLEDALGEAENEIHEWCVHHHFPTDPDPAILQETFAYVKEGRERIRRRDQAREAAQQIEADLAKRHEKIQSLCSRFHMDIGDSAASLEKMQERIDQAEDARQRRNQLQEKIQSLDEQMKALHDRVRQYQNECDVLMRQAGVEDEESYLRKGRAWEESCNLNARLTSNQAQLQVLARDESEVKRAKAALADDEDADSRILQLEEEIKQLEQKEQDLQGRMAELNAQKAQLEDGGTYAERYHYFTQVQEQLRDQARRWAVYRLAEHWLKQAKERYRNDRLPQVIETASQYFATMTDGRYPILFAPAKEGFVVERTDGSRFSPKQLSRGTVEQLYLALRLALARLYQSPSPYPLITDDILVNFDGQRVKQAVAAMRQMAEAHQVLFFTCHHHLLQHFLDYEVSALDDGRDVLTPDPR